MNSDTGCDRMRSEDAGKGVWTVPTLRQQSTAVTAQSNGASSDGGSSTTYYSAG
jgi:hypothetical protein